ncbi:hypothetical protein ASG73_14435 [Janibacter sp. Soil728]|uniref:TetR/AcrR family transcriptional regulator n=1 Tax=Janibacter sp. Soil728 TaxID=1736393 RepID=UPI0006FE93AC|nr:TetR/AcrR family transcriptional regulator [Janibacter sp. Soil728]KRE35879.1 hypothetical protein ASG73_14435 [Janibacter sp. Soil728]
MATQPRTRISGASVPDLVLAAATRLFAQQGFEATSVQQIVDAAGVTKGAMYHYFSSKDELLTASYRQLLDRQLEHLVEISGRDLPVVERLRLIAEVLVLTTLADLDRATAFHNSMHLLRAPSRTTIREQRRTFRRTFEDVVREGIASGELREDLSVDLVMFNFMGAIGYLTVWFTPDGPRTPDEVASAYGDMLIAALV